MFGLGTWETIIILVVALIFLGPDKLPEIARSVGKGFRSLRKAMSSVEREVGDVTDYRRWDQPQPPVQRPPVEQHPVDPEAPDAAHDDDEKLRASHDEVASGPDEPPEGAGPVGERVAAASPVRPVVMHNVPPPEDTDAPPKPDAPDAASGAPSDDGKGGS